VVLAKAVQSSYGCCLFSWIDDNGCGSVSGCIKGERLSHEDGSLLLFIKTVDKMQPYT